MDIELKKLFIVKMVENRVYCNFCDKFCIERFYKNHLKSQTHTNNIRKKILYKINMSCYCDVCDKTIKVKSKKNHLKSLSHKEFDKCKHIKLTIKNPDINKIDNAVYEYIIEHNKKYDYYLIKCDFKIVFNNSEYSPHITSELFDKKNNDFLDKFFGKSD